MQDYIIIFIIGGIIAFFIYKLNERALFFAKEREEMPEEELSEADEIIIGKEPEADFRLVEMGQDSKFRPFVVKMTPEQFWWYDQKSREDKRKVKALCLAGKDPFPELTKLEYQARKDKRKFDAEQKKKEKC